MKKIMTWVLAATLTCGASVFTSCSSDDDDNSAQEQAKKNRKEFVEHTRATMKDLAENLNFTSWNAANNLNLYFNQYVLNNPEFNQAVLAAFMQKYLQSVKTVEEGSELAEMGYTLYGSVDFSEFNYRFTMNADNTGFDVEEAEDFEVVLNGWNTSTQRLENGIYKLTLKAGGNQSFKYEHAYSQAPNLAIVVVIPSEFRFAISDKTSGTWQDVFTGSFTNDVKVAAGHEYAELSRDGWQTVGTVTSNFPVATGLNGSADQTTLNFSVSDDRETKEISREFSFVQNGRNMLSIVANGHDVFGRRPSDPGTDMGDMPDMGEGGGPEKPDLDGDGKPDEPPTTSNSDSQLLDLLLNAVAGKSFDKLSLTLLDDLTTTMSISDCSRALQLAQEEAQARRSYADEATIDQFTQQLNALIKAEITCKGVSQTIPMTLVTQKLGIDYWTMPAFNFADESGYVSLIDLLDAESVAYGINIIDHAVEPMQQSIIVVRQLLQYFQTLMGTMQQQPNE